MSNDTGRYEWLRPVDLEGRSEADSLAGALRPPLTVIEDVKTGNFMIAFDQEKADQMTEGKDSDQERSDSLKAHQDHAPKEGTSIDSRPENLTLEDLTQAEREIAEHIAGISDDEWVATPDLEDDPGYSGSTNRQALKKLRENGFLEKDQDGRTNIYQPTEQLREAIDADADA